MEVLNISSSLATLVTLLYSIFFQTKKKLMCQYCDKTFSKNFDLQQHIRSHTGIYILLTSDLMRVFIYYMYLHTTIVIKPSVKTLTSNSTSDLILVGFIVTSFKFLVKQIQIAYNHGLVTILKITILVNLGYLACKGLHEDQI